MVKVVASPSPASAWPSILANTCLACLQSRANASATRIFYRYLVTQTKWTVSLETSCRSRPQPCMALADQLHLQRDSHLPLPCQGQDQRQAPETHGRCGQLRLELLLPNPARGRKPLAQGCQSALAKPHRLGPPDD